jgi:hypothetical protein
MKIYTIGDSWVYGDGLDNPSEDAWPIVLANQLGASVYNDSCLGGSNSHFVYQTIKHLQEDFDFYIVVWTHTAKFTFCKYNDNSIVHFSPALTHDKHGNEDYYKIWGRTLYQVWHNRLYAVKCWLQQIIQLQTLLKFHNKNYLMLNCHENDLSKWLSPWPEFIDSTKKLLNFDLMDDQQIYNEYKEIQFYASKIDTDHFYKWNDFYLRQLADTGWPGHPTKEGHLYIADMLYNNVKLNNV